jgi:hypothetical protein
MMLNGFVLDRTLGSDCTDGDVGAIASGMYTLQGCARKGSRRRDRAPEHLGQ